MKEPLYISSEGILQRKENTLYFVNKEGKKPLPVESISEIYCYGKVSLRSGAASLLMNKGIPVHYFNKYGYYEGSQSGRQGAGVAERRRENMVVILQEF